MGRRKKVNNEDLEIIEQESEEGSMEELLPNKANPTDNSPRHSATIQKVIEDNTEADLIFGPGNIIVTYS